MKEITWLIAADQGHINGMTAAAKKLGGKVCMAVIGDEKLAELAAQAAPDQLIWFAADETIPPEAFAKQVADRIAADEPELILTLPDAASRTIWGITARNINAAVTGTLFEVKKDNGVILAERLVADERAVEMIEVSGQPLAGIFDGDDTDPAEKPCEIEPAVISVEGIDMKIAPGSTSAAEEDGGIRKAKRLIGVGYGLGSKDDLVMVEELAQVMGAEVGCSLPISEQLGWFGPERVVGITHNRIAPDFYITLGISGQPQHMAATRDAKVIVGINIDPEASIFRKCDYGVVGDVNKILPALLEAARSQL